MPSSRVRLCLLQPETPSPGYACASLFNWFGGFAAAEGHSVTRAVVSDDGIRILASPGEAEHVAEPLPYRLVGPESAHAAYRVLEWLRGETFDLVCAPACPGLLFYALTARDHGLALQATTFCAIADRLSLLSRHLAGEMPLGIDDVVNDTMERRTLALADLSVFPDATIAAWAEQNSWSVPGLHSMPGTDDAEVAARAIWSELLGIAERRRTAASPGAAEDELPLVSVCIPHFNRPELLRQAIDSIRSQTYPRLEIVVVDDASTTPDALAALEELGAELTRHGGQLVRHESNRYLGAARNTGARHARGEFILFLDDDDYAKPEQVATLVQVARSTCADIVNSFCDRLAGEQPPQPGQHSEERWLTLGNAPSVGLFQNLFGTASALFRKSSFQRLGGFSELRGVGCEDWEIFARASLAGMNLQTVPQALYWYRLTPGSMLQTGSAHAGSERVLAAYFPLVPQVLWPVLRFAHGADARLRQLEGDLRHREAVRRHREEVIAHRDSHIAHLGKVNRELTLANRERTEQIKSMSLELTELRAVCRVTLGGYGATPQAAVDAVLNSASWRFGAMLRAPLRWLTGRRQSAPPRVSDWVQAAIVIGMMQRSTSWELTGPLRALSRLIWRR